MACLASVAASRHRPARIVVVDNGTGTLDARAVDAAAPGAELVAVPHNLGFAGGHNLVIGRALAERVRHHEVPRHPPVDRDGDKDRAGGEGQVGEPGADGAPVRLGFV